MPAVNLGLPRARQRRWKDEKVIARWGPQCAVFVGAAVVLLASDGVAGIVFGVLLFGYGWVVSPAFFPRSADLQVAVERATSGQAPLVFWKPGCIYCIRLRVGLGWGGRRVSWVDSSADERAEAVVRSKNGGDHTTPTVTFRDETRTNPDVDWVRSLSR